MLTTCSDMMWLAAQAKRHPAPGRTASPARDYTAFICAATGVRLEEMRPAHPGGGRGGLARHPAYHAVPINRPALTPAFRHHVLYLWQRQLCGAAGGCTWRGSGWRNSLTSFSRSPVFCIPGLSVRFAASVRRAPSNEVLYSERRKWSPWNGISPAAWTSGSKDAVASASGAAMTDRDAVQRRSARQMASERAPTKRRLTAQVASKLNQLRDTNFSPK